MVMVFNLKLCESGPKIFLWTLTQQIRPSICIGHFKNGFLKRKWGCSWKFLFRLRNDIFCTLLSLYQGPRGERGPPGERGDPGIKVRICQSFSGCCTNFPFYQSRLPVSSVSFCNSLNTYVRCQFCQDIQASEAIKHSICQQFINLI